MTRPALGHGLDLKKDEIEIEQKPKFRLFFTALIFAVLSFAVQHPVASKRACILKITEILAWVILFSSGYFSLALCGKFHFDFIEKLKNKIRWNDEKVMWCLFYSLHC